MNKEDLHVGDTVIFVFKGFDAIGVVSKIKKDMCVITHSGGVITWRPYNMVKHIEKYFWNYDKYRKLVDEIYGGHFCTRNDYFCNVHPDYLKNQYGDKTLQKLTNDAQQALNQIKLYLNKINTLVDGECHHS